MGKSHASPEQTGFPGDRFAAQLLGWYAKHRRILPWRALPGQVASPYHVWLSEIMLQQTTVQAVIAYFEKFIGRWPTVQALAAADPDEVMQAWAGLGYYARARNLLKCAGQVCGEHHGVFPKTEIELLRLPGIGPYTSAAIASIAFNIPATVVDGNVERVAARVFKIMTSPPQGKPEIHAAAHVLYQDVAAPGDFAQALMDLGATICIPKTPRCGICPVADLCLARAAGCQAELPVKAPKKLRPQRHDKVYWLRTPDGRVVLERRAEHRMLGGMNGLPTTDWDAAGQAFEPPPELEARLSAQGRIHHTFTHFDLTLDIIEAEICLDELPQGGWILKDNSAINAMGLPTLFRKVVKLKKSNLDPI